MLVAGSNRLIANEGFCQTVDAYLRAALGTDFGLWVRLESQWFAWPGWQPIGEELCADSLPLVDLLDAAASRLTATSIAAAPDREVLAVPFSEGAVTVVAVASLTTAELPQRLGRSLQQGLALSRKFEESQVGVEECATQISEDFEQILYLQTLGQHLQMCEVSRSPLDVARVVLPVLRDLIRAESLLLITPPHQPAAEGSDPLTAAAPDLVVGQQDVKPLIWRQIMRQFQSAAHTQPVIRNRLQGEIDGICLSGLDSFLLTPIARDQQQIGWLLALNRTRDPVREQAHAHYPPWGLSGAEFGTVESGLMQAAANMLATHAHNVHLFHDKERLLIGVLRSLINAMDAKDSYTCGHSDRVALVARRLGEELGLTREECNSLYISGLVHDIGKIGVPDAVLLKPGKLTDEEFAQIQRHPEQGYTILKHLNHLAQVLPGVLHHHERYDGRGYPRGLQGEAIPLAARILAVADSYDAMSSCRPYRTALLDAKVEAILREGAGSQWDPRVIEAFLRILPEIRALCGSSETHKQEVLTASTPPADDEALLHDSLSAALSMTTRT